MTDRTMMRIQDNCDRNEKEEETNRENRPQTTETTEQNDCKQQDQARKEGRPGRKSKARKAHMIDQEGHEQVGEKEPAADKAKYTKHEKADRTGEQSMGGGLSGTRGSELERP